ncbi:MAG: tRNA glutamyl-Q(34) synthetase GluQRS [Betaproteobacteria bacterium]|nr:tRNA glutamyl-Q(34) synthetase GluQRS [Betaproteobacteria bacterium]
MTYVGRFAPSPTGPLHFGSLVAAVASYLDARAQGGRWLIRIEDVDTTRCRSEHEQGILATLSAYGLVADGAVIRQSARSAQYDAALAHLRSNGHLYACNCSRREIADSAVTGIDGPVYPGTCRTAALAESECALRVRTDDRQIRSLDRVQGAMELRLQSQIGDFVVKRRDGCHTYQLAVVVDDAEQGVTHVVRGADLLASTPRQIHLQRLLGLPTPSYLHIPVAANAAGEKLSKQTLATEVSAERAVEWLQHALQFLGQAPAGIGKAACPRELLDIAAQQWNVAAIPNQRVLPAHFVSPANGQ